MRLITCTVCRCDHTLDAREDEALAPLVDHEVPALVGAGTARGTSAGPPGCWRAPARCTAHGAGCDGRSRGRYGLASTNGPVCPLRPLLERHQRGPAREREGRLALLGLQRHAPAAAVHLMRERDLSSVEVARVEILRPPKRPSSDSRPAARSANRKMVVQGHGPRRQVPPSVRARHSCRRAPGCGRGGMENRGWSRSAGITRIPFWGEVA
jgi:hypothetical protein